MQYVTLVEADNYLENRLNVEAWVASNEDQKIKALTHAESIINRLNLSIDLPNTLSVLFPTRIKEAIAEIALSLADGVDPEKEINNIYVTSRSYATTKTDYDRTQIPEHYQAGVPSAIAWQLLKPYLINNRSFRFTRVN